jgi:2-polyprenyl-3-methyl-5-hydroxy-6-metoxy-1,4-benzoquinol methylase
MDLRERRGEPLRRHPWETARLRACHRILRARSGPLRGASILDVGCGDAFVLRALSETLGSRRAVGVDASFAGLDAQERASHSDGGRLALLDDRRELGTERFDLLLFLDVLEHVPDDRGFLGDYVGAHLAAAGGRVLVTAPAFPSLFGAHDVALGHVRRYRRRELEAVAAAAGLRVDASGYLFASLLLVRTLATWLRRPRAWARGAAGPGRRPSP